MELKSVLLWEKDMLCCEKQYDMLWENLYAKYIIRNSRLDEAQAGIKIARRNINNLRYADDTTLMAEREVKSLLMKVKEESEKAGLKLKFRKLRSWCPVPSLHGK